MNLTLLSRAAEAFDRLFGGPPELVIRSPGRVNLIGEHTDYNDGFVLPMAIDREVVLAVRPHDRHDITVYSVNFDETLTFDLRSLANSNAGWLEYVKGMTWALGEAGLPITPFDGVLAGDIPRGAGLSSSAAVEMAVAHAFLSLAGLPWDAARMAQLGQRCENKWIGVNSGIMDQLVVASAEAGHASLIDCRSLATTPVPLPPDTSVVVLDTGTRRGLVDSAYNERRAQCEAAARHFGVAALRDVDAETFNAGVAGLDMSTARRARHVITENQRVLEAAAAMHAGDARRLGTLMNASHASLHEDFEVTNDALHVIATLAQAVPGCHGARMTGGGFGGCAVALVADTLTDRFVQQVAEQYREATGLHPRVYVSQPSAGTSLAT